RRDVLLQLPRPHRERVLDDQSGLRRSAVHRQHLRSRVEGMSGRSAPEAGIDFERMIADSRARVFLASFLVLFLEITLIRWMPAYVRLLSYFSNFILLASFLGIGLGCLAASSRRRLFPWFPLVQTLVIAAVYYFRLEVAVPTSGSIYFSSGTAAKVV